MRLIREQNLNHAGRLSLRQQHARPIFDELEKYLNNELLRVLLKNPIGAAIAYTRHC
jgi:hypothetical protein